MKSAALCFIETFTMSSLACVCVGFLFAYARLLTGECTQIVKFGTTNLAAFVNFNAVYVRRIDREYALHTHGAAHFANRETALVLMTAYLDYDSAEHLDTLLVSLDDFVCHRYSVARTECRKFLAGGKCFFSNFN